MMKLLYAWLQLVALEQAFGSSPTDTTAAATAAGETAASAGRRRFVEKPTADALYRQAGEPIPARAQDLLARMTLKEKVAQLLQPWEQKAPAEVFAQFNESGLGAWYLTMTTLPPHAELPVGATPPAPPTADGVATVKARNEMQRSFVENTRLGIPVTFIMETLHSGGPDATIFPMPVNFAASWNVTAAELAAQAIAAEARAVGTDRGFSPVVNMFPDARYGRVQEGYSEDPWMTKVMGAAHLNGLQGGALGGPDTYLNNFTHALVGTVKHYAAYGMSSGGIDGSPADLSEQKLREMYLAPFEYLADGHGLRSVMAAQNMVNGRPMHCNKRLLTDILRTEWNVTDALVESDGGDVIGALQGFHVGATREDVVVRSIESGMDMDLGGSAFSFDVLGNAVLSNRTSMAVVDRAVYRVLVSKFASGIFDHPYVDESRALRLDPPENRKMARDMAEESFVLAINENNTLPIKNIKSAKIALVGWLADSEYDHCGSYFNSGANVVTVKEAMESAGLQMTYSTGATPDNTNTTMIPEAVTAAQKADVVVAVLGDSQHTCGEMVDRSDLDLPGAQLPLLQALTATGTPVVVLLIHGRQVTFGRNNVGLDGVDALMIGWRPGEEGGPAFLNVISGKTSPSGRLAQAWPRSVGGIGGPGAPYLYPFQGNHMGESYSAGDGPSSPLFGFGHGLSYTSFHLSKFSATPNRTTADGTFTLSLVATNTGNSDGAVPIQVYFRDPVCYPVRIASIQLVRFKKVFLKAQESRTVTIELDARDLRYWDDGRNGNPAVGAEGGWVVDKGLFNLVVGTAGFTSWNNPQGLLGDVEVV